MKRLYVALGSALLLSAPAFASEAGKSAAMMSRLSQLNSPAHVKNVLLQQRTAQCEQNAKNLGLHGDDRTHYLGTCITRNEAAERFASLHGRT